jgi:hypothetical protein
MLPGFGCHAYPSDMKAFVLSYRYLGKKHMIILGRYGVVTVDQERRTSQDAALP